MNKSAAVLIVFPHSVCASKNLALNEFCDSTSKEASELLASKLDTDLLELYLLGFELGIPNVDMDIFMSRNTTFRRDLTKLASDLKRKYGDHIVAIDIHSFNPNERPEWKDSEIVIVETRTLHDALESVGLAYYLNNHGVSTKVVIGSEVDIAQEMDSYGIKNIVLEFNQTLSDSRLNKITDLIAEWIHKPAGGVPTSGIRGSRGYNRGYRGGGYRGGYGGGDVALATGLGLVGGLALGSALSGPNYGYGYPAYPPPGYYGYPSYPPPYPYYY